MSKKNNLYKLSAVINTYYVGMAQVFTSGLNYLLIAVLTGAGAEIYGTWVLVLFFGAYVTPWVSLGLENSLEKFLPGLRQDTYAFNAWIAACKTSFLASVIAGSIALSLGETLAEILFGDSEHYILVTLASLIFFSESQLAIGSAVLRAREEIRIISKLNIFRSVVDLIGISAFSIFTNDVELLLSIKILVCVSFIVVQQFAIKKILKYEKHENDYSAPIGEYINFGLPMVPANFIWLLMAGIDRFMLNKYGNVVDVALYSLADSIAISINNFSKPIGQVIKPRIANVVYSQPQEEAVYITKAIKFQALLLLPGCVLISALSSGIIEVFFGSEFLVSTEFIPILCCAHLLIGVGGALNNHVLFRRGSAVFLYFLPLCLLVNVVINIFLIPTYGGIGASISTFVSHLVYIISLIVLTEKRMIVQLLDARSVFVKIIISTALMIVITFGLIETFPEVSRYLWALIGFVVYASCIYRLRLITNKESEAILSPFYRLLGFLNRQG